VPLPGAGLVIVLGNGKRALNLAAWVNLRRCPWLPIARKGFRAPNPLQQFASYVPLPTSAL